MGQPYVLLSRGENLRGGPNLECLNAAHLLREQFEQLWSYTDPADARSFVDNWQLQFQGHNLTP